MKYFSAFLLFIALLVIGWVVWFGGYTGLSYVPPAQPQSKPQVKLITQIDVTNSGVYDSKVFQSKWNPWYINLNYTPLNDSASVYAVIPGGGFYAGVLVPTTTQGSFSVRITGAPPVYLSVYANTWHLTVTQKPLYKLKALTNQL